MRAYSAASEEALRARNLLKDWADEGFLTEAQYQRMEQETVCDLRRTNIFLRLVLFLFTLMIVGAGVALFFEVLLSHPSTQTTSIFLVIFSAAAYAAAELAVSRSRFYRYGIEEALAICSAGFLCAGMQTGFFNGGIYSEFVVSAAGALASLWIWHRFGLAYAFLAAMIFVLGLPGYWTSSHSAQHVIVGAIYAAGLIAVIATRSRHRFTYLNNGYSIVEALLWFGIYVAINLQLSSPELLGQWDGARAGGGFPKTFYWSTWVLIWCLPPAMLARGVRRKDRGVIAAGATAALLTLITNKPYLGWQRHSWDPMLLGALLIGVALFLRRWMAKGPSGVRHGFTAKRLSRKDKDWMSAGSTALGLVSPISAPLNPEAGGSEAHFSGGDSGGGGATSDF
jgi:hypothetical protein